MAYDGKLLSRARERLEEIKTENENEHRRRISEIYYRIPEIREIDTRMRSHMAQLVRITLSRSADMEERLNALKEQNIDMQMRRAELLTEHHYPSDYLDEIYYCRRCRDTGVFENGVCTCLQTLYNRELTKELAVLLRRGDECFENFDFSLYSNVLDRQTGLIPRIQMGTVYEICRTFAERFPDAPIHNLLLRGSTGLGKTYLSACIARVVAEKGCSVCYDSAASALEAFERQKFSRDPEETEAAAARVRRMLGCDLMILDDLGTEMISPMSVSALYNLINTRLVNGKRTILSTNLSVEEIRRKYGPQIASRLEGEFQELPFAGSDIRMLKKEM